MDTKTNTAACALLNDLSSISTRPCGAAVILSNVLFVRRKGSAVSKSAWISAGKVSAAIAAVALLLGAVFQGQAQQRSDMADVRAALRSGFAEVNGRFAEVNVRLENISGDLVSLRERAARIEGQLALRADAGAQANMAPETEEDG